jgi:hypothetical protein
MENLLISIPIPEDDFVYPGIDPDRDTEIRNM